MDGSRKTKSPFRFFAATAVALSLYACGHDNPVNPVGGRALGFADANLEAPEHMNSRAGEYPVGGRFGVFGYYTVQSLFNTNTSSGSKPNLMCNQMVEKTLTGCTYSPVKYWSDNPTDRYSFFAYSPYNGAGISALPTEATPGTPTLIFTIQDDPAEKVDLVTAVVKDKLNDWSTVDLSFKHALCRIRFSLVFDQGVGTTPEFYRVQFTSIKISGVKNTGKLTFATPSTWANLTGNASYELLQADDPSDDITVDFNNETNILDTKPLYVIPHNGTAGQPIVVEIEYMAYAPGDPKPYLRTHRYQTISTSNWAVNTIVTYKMTLRLSRIDFKVMVEDWDSNDVSGGGITDEPIF